MADRTTKLLLLAIAVGLWMSVAAQWVRPVSVQATNEATVQDGSWENTSAYSLRYNYNFSQAVQLVVEGECEVESTGRDIDC